MKTKILLLLYVAIILMTACEKKIITKTGDDPIPSKWKYSPAMRMYNGDGVYQYGSGLSAVYEYKGSFTLNCFESDPGNGPFYMASVYDKDGISGTKDDVIYTDNTGSYFWYFNNILTPATITDHTGFDFYIQNGRFNFSLRTMDVSSSGCSIKYMPAVYANGKMIWMHLPSATIGNDITYDLFKSGKVTNLN
ncbi:hypothetical protein COT98_02285 [Candidatus Falkowbacteria bacterium CG10_big_fil_rev_8_21_14_0_10_39_9]|uniref:Uncharacterized protein n=1 Tax=Candidatus Falkowbacteria bacterium CG10_big_fil_rev_8_21_14_0_10_39_9 TaxID=1974566 RepID=A0A2M6WPW1_9BACT|nr:MAG: hypothetical protein COT98_02285 [Candidatus Falkowbacteria bacterium CG10_big_fil_rev_8_21_14_0_10_39_9]